MLLTWTAQEASHALLFSSQTFIQKKNSTGKPLRIRPTSAINFLTLYSLVAPLRYSLTPCSTSDCRIPPIWKGVRLELFNPKDDFLGVQELNTFRLEDSNKDQNMADGQDGDTDVEVGNYRQQQRISGRARASRSSKR